MTEMLPGDPGNTPPKRRHTVRNIGIGVSAAFLALIVLAIVGAILSTPENKNSNAATISTNTPIVSQSPSPNITLPSTPNPKGNYTGSCDYTLSSGINGYDHLIGEIDLHNTGNIGTINRVKMSWPQEGYSPITAHKTVRLSAGHSTVVRFHIPVSQSGNVIDQLQSWQESHNLRDGCKYRVTITGTYGNPQ